MPARSLALKVAVPCPYRWEEMAGDDRVRFCARCQQHVYNVASLTEPEARALIEEREGRVCVRLNRRSDGTVITRDCWYVLRRARERLIATGLGLAVAAAGFWGSVGFLRWFMAMPDARTECPRPAAEPEAPESLPEWLTPGHTEEQGPRRSPKSRRRMRPKQVEPVIMGVLAKFD